MMKKNILIFIIVLISTIFAKSQTKDFKLIQNTYKIQNKIEEVAKSTNTIKSDFLQEKYMDFLEEKITSRGKFFYKKENKIRWEYTKPYNYLILINGDKITIKDNEKENHYDAKSSELFKKINDLIVSTVKGNILKNPDFTVTLYQNSKFYMVILVPKEKQMLDYLSKIEIYFYKSNYSVNRFVMYESATDYTSIVFINKKVNEKIPDSNFIVK